MFLSEEQRNQKEIFRSVESVAPVSTSTLGTHVKHKTCWYAVQDLIGNELEMNHSEQRFFPKIKNENWLKIMSSNEILVSKRHFSFLRRTTNDKKAPEG